MTKASQILRLLESEETVTLFSGGSGLEYLNNSVISHSKGRWEYGPGLYLTTDYEIAQRYAKGSRKLYLVTVEKGTDINSVNLKLGDVQKFVSEHVTTRKKSEVLDAVKRVMDRVGLVDRINADSFLSIIINYEAIVNTKSGTLKQFLVDCGVDYYIVGRGLGNDKMLVLMNNKKIKKVEVVNRSKLKFFTLPFNW